MTPTNSPRFNYRKHLDSPAEIRLLRADRNHHYVLQFRVAGRTPFHLWHTVRQYIPTNSQYDRPGCRHSSVYGRWHEVCYYTPTRKEGNDRIAELKERFPTVRAIFESFVKPGLDRQKSDLDAYLDHAEKSRVAPRVFR